MPDLTATDIADLVAVTLRDLGSMRFQQIAQDLVHFEVFSKWFVKDKVVFDSGIDRHKSLDKLGHLGNKFGKGKFSRFILR